MPGQLFVFSAPSGAGKSTIVNALRKSIADLGYSISHTSRRPRGAEKDGIDYHFVDRETFSRMIKEGAFVEWAEVYDEFYGTSFSSLNEQTALGTDVVLDLDVQGARNIKKHFRDSVLTYVMPPSLEILERRLKHRGTDSERIIISRLKKAAEEIKSCGWYDYIIINDDLEKAIGEAKAIIISEQCKIARRMQRVKELFDSLFS